MEFFFKHFPSTIVHNSQENPLLKEVCKEVKHKSYKLSFPCIVWYCEKYNKMFYRYQLSVLSTVSYTMFFLSTFLSHTRAVQWEFIRVCYWKILGPVRRWRHQTKESGVLSQKFCVQKSLDERTFILFVTLLSIGTP